MQPVQLKLCARDVERWTLEAAVRTGEIAEMGKIETLVAQRRLTTWAASGIGRVRHLSQRIAIVFETEDDALRRNIFRHLRQCWIVAIDYHPNGAIEPPQRLAPVL